MQKPPTPEAPAELGLPEAGEDLEAALKSTKRVFIWSASLSFFIVLLTMFFLNVLRQLPPVARVAYPGVLLWSLTVTVCSFRSLIQLLSKASQKLERRSFVDQVSGVFNSRYLDLRMQGEYERARRYGGFAAILYVDIDDFRKVNSLYGHQAGDMVLEDLGAIMGNAVRTCDVLGRLSDDEFLAILPETDRREATVVAGRIREGIEEYSLQLAEGQIDFVRVSVGVAAYPVNGDTMENVISAAHNAAAKAKDGGGNTVLVAEEFISSEVVGDREIRMVRGAEEPEAEASEVQPQ